MELPEEPEDFSPEDELDQEAILDRTPLKFGKYRGKTPEWVVENEGYRAKSYITWAYETVGNFDVCSAALYRDCGGKGKRAEGTHSQTANKRVNQNPSVDTYESRGYSSNPVPRDVRYPPGTPPKQGYFDDFDDDIPF